MGSMAQVSFRKTLVSAQVALSLLLLIGAGLFARSLSNLRTLDPGFRTTNLVQFAVGPRSLGYTVEQSKALLQRLDERLRNLPGVRGVGMAVVAVLANNEWDNWVTIEGYNPKRSEIPDPHVNFINAGYFDALQIPRLAGRDFTLKDVANAPKVAIVNEKFARKYFHDGLAVGHRFGMGSDPTTPIDIEIVGVVKDTRYENLRDEIPEEIYFPYQQTSNLFLTYYVRTERQPDSAFQTIRSTVREMDVNLPVLNMKTLDGQLEESLVTERMIASLATVFGALATALAIIGLYGVMAFMVARRSREIGIRMALGAQSGNVVWLVMREVLVLVGAGLAAGLPAAYGLTRLVRAQLYGVEPHDAVSMALATVLLAIVAVLAGYIPARRAASYDPVKVLRYE
jgi:predicted permease